MPLSGSVSLDNWLALSVWSPYPCKWDIHEPSPTELSEGSEFSFPSIFTPRSLFPSTEGACKHLSQITSLICSEPSVSHFTLSKSQSPHWSPQGLARPVLTSSHLLPLLLCGQATLVFSPALVNPMSVSGSLHWCFSLPGPLPLKYLRDSLPHLLQVFIQMSPSQLTLGLKSLFPSYPIFFICLPGIIVSSTFTAF